MKRAATLTASILIAVTIGVWLGYQRRNPPIKWGFSVSEACGGGYYSTETFRRINDEVGPKIDALFGEHVSQDLFIAVIPFPSGFAVRAAGSSNSKLFKEPMESQLTDWIMWRMDELRYEENQSQNKASHHNPLPAPSLIFPSDYNPQPEPKPRSR